MLIKKGDSHNFMLGVLASITAVIVWDLAKHHFKILNYTINKK
jgi:hypothetical protein